MAQFITKVDYFGLAADDNGLVCIKSDDGRSNELAQATGQDGAYVASNVYAEKIAPSCDYAVAAAVTMAAGGIALGSCTETDDATVCLGNFTIGTGAGSSPTVSASGEQVEEGGEAQYVFGIPAFSLKPTLSAQVLFSAFELSGTGCHLKSANYAASCTIGKATKDGVCLSHDVVEGKIECTVDVIQTGSAEPTLTAGTGWEVTAVPSCSNPDADWPTWSATLTYYLTKTEPSD